jgi:uncharacterized membrane protein YsdA (DUF1294 family)
MNIPTADYFLETLMTLSAETRLTLFWLVVINMLGCVMVLWDKRVVQTKAKEERANAPVIPVTFIAAIGGSPGMLLGFSLFKHAFESQVQRFLFACVVLGQLLMLGTIKEWIGEHL